MAKPSTIFYVVAYDSPHDGRRNKIFKTLSGYGQWTQFSLFECHLTDKQYVALRQKLSQILHLQEDNVRFYMLCAGCMGKVDSIGSPKPHDPITLIV